MVKVKEEQLNPLVYRPINPVALEIPTGEFPVIVKRIAVIPKNLCFLCHGCTVLNEIIAVVKPDAPCVKKGLVEIVF